MLENIGYSAAASMELNDSSSTGLSHILSQLVSVTMSIAIESSVSSLKSEVILKGALYQEDSIPLPHKSQE